MRKLIAAFTCFALLTAPQLALGKDQNRIETLRFPPGATRTTVKDKVKGYNTVSYQLTAKAGQVMKVKLTSTNGATYFNVYEPGKKPGDAALATSDVTPEINRFEGALPKTGVYTISVYLVRAAARRNEVSRFALDVAITSKSGVVQPGPVTDDFADSLAGGPDFWEVTGVAANDALNLRRGPSAQDKIVGSVRNGTILRNRGCRMADGQRWCLVELPDTPAVAGWVAGRFLREASVQGGSPSGVGKSRDAKVAGTDFNATGEVPCARDQGQPMARCRFGVARQGNGAAVVTIFWPDGGQRAIFFEKGKPAYFDQSQADGDARMKVRQDGDLFVIGIGQQRFEIPEAVISGG